MPQETTAGKDTRCPLCGLPGKRVGKTTMCALLKSEHQARLRRAADPRVGTESSSGSASSPAECDAYHFCASPGCPAVYFNKAVPTAFTIDHLRVPVGIKQTSGVRRLCYCFGHSMASIKQEIRAKGRSHALEQIQRKIRELGCRCETENPSGSCCLQSVAEGIQKAHKELKDDRTTPGESETLFQCNCGPE